MEAKSKVWHHGGQTDNLCILFRDLGRCRSSQEIEIDNPTDRVVFQVLTSFLGVVDFDVHTIAVEKKYTVRTVSSTVVKIDWMVAIEVCAFWDRICITGPERSSIISCVQLETCQW